MALASSPQPRRERWPWLPVLFLRSRTRAPAPPAAEPRPGIDPETRDLFRLIAGALPRCAAPESDARRELEDISDRLEALAGGMPEQAWAESLARDLAGRNVARAPAPPIRVSWSEA